MAVDNSCRAGPNPERRRGLGAIGRAGQKNGAGPWGGRRRPRAPRTCGATEPFAAAATVDVAILTRPRNATPIQATVGSWIALPGPNIGFVSRGKPVPMSDARAPKRPPWLDLVTARGERVAPFGLRPGATDPGRPDKACYALQGRPARRVAPSSTGRPGMWTAVAPDASRRTPRGSSRLRMEPPAAFPPWAADSPPRWVT